MLSRLFAFCGASLAVSLLWQTPSVAQAGFPERPITMIVSYAAGGPSDIIARALAQSMSVSLGQPIVIENVAGAGGTAGAARAAKAQPDGHTLLIHHLALAAGAGLYPNLPYDTLSAFEPIGLVNFNPFVLTSKKGLAINTAREAIEYIRANKDKVAFGHAGVGSGSHLCNLLLQSALGIKVAEVAYRGTAPAMNDVVAGQIEFLFDQTLGAIPQIQAGTIKAFAVTSSARIDQLKDLPTMAEAGLAGFEVTQWHALYAPARTPKAALDKIGAALEMALKDESIIKRFTELGSPTFPAGKRGPLEAKAMLKSEVEKWSRVIKTAGVSASN
jgi:tripartite-type tricarboxylate transporter receptor subunit TctC